MSADHFRAECSAAGAVITDLGSRFGTFVNGSKIDAPTPVGHGAEVRAGRSVFIVTLTGVPAVTVTPPPPSGRITPAVPADEPATLPPSTAGVLAHLRGVADPLYALLDAGRDPAISTLVARTGAAVERLADDPAAAGPWLVRVNPESAVLTDLVAAGWGANWGVYLTCRRPADALKTHLRRFLTQQLPDGRSVDFRFYDPRVLRTHLPTLTAAEVSEFVGPVGRYVVESPEPGEVIEFAAAYKDWRKLTPADPAGV